MVPTLSFKYALVFFSCTFNLLSIPICALNIGAETVGVAVSVSKDCSRQCESSFCSVPPLLRYGKYCGLLYSGCPGERPCDGLDACCMKHDQCVQEKNNRYSRKLNQSVPFTVNKGHLVLLHGHAFKFIRVERVRIEKDGEKDHKKQKQICIRGVGG